MGEFDSGEHVGRVAVVTGGSRGIGRGVSLELARQGCAVVVHGQSRETGLATVQEILNAGGRAVAVSGNVAEEEVAIAIVDAALSNFGRLDTVVTSAGIQRYGSVVETTSELWDEVFGVNVRGAFLVTHHAAEHVRRSPSGSIVLIASVQGTATQNDVVAYTASKGALIAFARALAIDEARYGVRVNSVSPGSVDTPMLRAAAADFSDGTDEAVDALLSDWGRAHPLGRIATIEEVGAVVSFVASPRASFVSGTDIRVDGGLLARLPAALPKKES